MSRTKHPRKHLFWFGTAIMILSGLLFVMMPITANSQAPNTTEVTFWLRPLDWTGAWNYGSSSIGPPLGNPCWKPSSTGYADDKRPYLTLAPDGTVKGGCNLDQPLATKSYDGTTGFKNSVKLTGNFKCDQASFTLDGTYETIYDNGSVTFHIIYQGSGKLVNEFGDIGGNADYSWTCSYIRNGKQSPCYDTIKYPSSGKAEWRSRGTYCAVQPPAAQPPAALPATGNFAVGHGCSYNEPRDSPGQLRCAAASTNEPQGAAITFKWMLDGQVQPEAGKPFTRDDQGITPGDHTITVLAVDTKSKQESLSSSFQFTKPGAALSVIIQCALRSGDDRAVACYADPKNMPDGAALTYEWMWNGATAAETGRTLNKDALTDGLYTIQVRAKDSKSGKTTSLASTTVQVGSPSKPGAAPAPKSAASFAVNVNCAYDSKMDEVLCSAKPVNTPADANLAYDWLWNGKTQGAKGTNLTVRVPVTYSLYTVQVRATDSKSGQSTPVVSTQIRAGSPPASPLETILSPEQWVAVNMALTNTPSPDPPEPVKAAAATAAGAAILGLLLAANNALSGAAGTASQVAAGVAGWLPAAGTGRPTSAPEGKTAGPPAAPPPPTTLPEQGGASIAAPPAPPPKPATLPEQKYTDEVLEEVIESVVRFDTPEQGMASALFPSPPPPKPTTLPEQKYTDQVLEEVIESIVHFDTLEQGSASIAAPPSPPPPKPTTLPERDCKQDPERDWMNEPIPGGGEG